MTTRVRTPGGRPIVIGGLLRQETTLTESRVPVLGDIPLLGLLFRAKGEHRQHGAGDLHRAAPRIRPRGAAGHLDAPRPPLPPPRQGDPRMSRRSPRPAGPGAPARGAPARPRAAAVRRACRAPRWRTTARCPTDAPAVPPRVHGGQRRHQAARDRRPGPHRALRRRPAGADGGAAGLSRQAGALSRDRPQRARRATSAACSRASTRRPRPPRPPATASCWTASPTTRRSSTWSTAW